VHIEESDKIIEVLEQMNRAVHYIAERVSWSKRYDQEDFEHLLEVNVFLTNMVEALRLLDVRHGGSLIKFLCQRCPKPLALISQDDNNTELDDACSECRDKLKVAISKTMMKRMKSA